MNKNKIILSLSFLLLAGIYLLPVMSLAEDGAVNTGGTSYKITIPNPLKKNVNSLPALIQVLIDDVVIPIGSIIAVLMIMYAGFLFVTSAGNESKVKKARDALVNAAIGAAILLGAKGLSLIIEKTVTQLK